MSDRGIYQAIDLNGQHVPSKGTVIAEAPATDDNRCPDEIMKLWQPGKIVIAWYHHRDIKRLSKESLASRRKKRTKNRLQKKFPLFADQLFERELAERPGHFAGERPED